MIERGEANTRVWATGRGKVGAKKLNADLEAKDKETVRGRNSRVKEGFIEEVRVQMNKREF